MKRRLVALLVCALALLCAAASAEVAAPAIVLRAGSVAPGNTVWFGSNEEWLGDAYGPTPLKSNWRVLESGSIKALLIMDKVESTTEFNESNSDGNAWQGSMAQQWCIDLYNHWREGPEKAAILPTTVEETEVYTCINNRDEYGPASLDGEYFFFLSVREADELFANSDDRRAVNSDGGYQDWWLRSPSFSHSGIAAHVNPGGNIENDGVGSYHDARSAFNLNLSSVLFTSAAEGGKTLPDEGGLCRIQNASGTDWKLTLLDSTRTFTAQPAEGAMLSHVAGSAGWTVPVAYEGAETGDGEWISALLCKGNAALYYGRLESPAAASGAVDVPLPVGLPVGNYTLYVFNERLNGDKLSDFSSALSAIELTVTETALEYLDEDGVMKMSDSVATFLDSGDGQWGAGWYAAAGNVEIGERVHVTGNAKLILADGAALHIPKGITVPAGSSLTIYAQSTNAATMGALTVDNADEGCAGIGGSNSVDCGAITIVGGHVTSRGYALGSGGAGIGGGMRKGGGNVTIRGGWVEAGATRFSAAIGAGYQGTSATVTISGGTVRAECSSGAAAIGGGQMSGSPNNACDIVVRISGGIVSAIKKPNSTGELPKGAGIGAGYYWGAGRLEIGITGGTVTANCGSGYQAIGGPSTNAPMPTLTLGEVAVRPGGETAAASISWKRKTACMNRNVHIAPCAHSWYGGVCAWCGRIGDSHAFPAAAFTLPEGTTAIGANAFEGAKMTVVDARNCADIGAGAFAGCDELRLIRLPQNCSIDATAFDGCDALVAIFGPDSGTAAEWARAREIPFTAIQEN